MNLFSVAGAIVEGVVQIPVDLYYGGRRTLEDVGAFGAEAAQENAAERERVLNLVQDAFRNRGVIARMVGIIVDDFMAQLPEETVSKMSESLQHSGVRFASNKAAQFTLSAYLGRKLTEKIVTQAIAQRIAKFGVGIAVSAVLIQGLLERSSNATQRLARVNPRLHSKLKTQGLDMLYFMAEEQLAPLVTADAVKLRDPASYEAFLRSLEEALGK